MPRGKLAHGPIVAAVGVRCVPSLRVLRSTILAARAHPHLPAALARPRDAARALEPRHPRRPLADPPRTLAGGARPRGPAAPRPVAQARRRLAVPRHLGLPRGGPRRRSPR